MIRLWKRILATIRAPATKREALSSAEKERNEVQAILSDRRDELLRLTIATRIARKAQHEH